MCAPVPLGAAALAAAVDEGALVELLYPVSFASTKASLIINRIQQRKEREEIYSVRRIRLRVRIWFSLAAEKSAMAL